MPDAGAQEATARALLALSAEWTVLDDVVWPGRKPADIDHVVVGPGGVFIVVVGTGKAAATAGRSAASVLSRGARLRRSAVQVVVCSADLRSGDPGEGVLRCTPDTLVPLLLGEPPVLERDDLVRASATVTSQVRRERGVRHTLAGDSNRRNPRAGSTGRLAIFLLLVAATVAAAPWAAARLEAARAGDPSPVPILGETLRVTGTSAHPPVDLTADHVDAPGKEYVVELTVRNDGTAPLSMGDLDVGLTLDNLHVAEPVGQERSDLASAELLPGKERTVTYRFTVTSGRHPRLVVVVVGDRRTDRASWQVP